MKKKNVSQANTSVGRNESDWFLVGSLGSYGDGGGGGGGGTLLDPLFRSNVWKFLSVEVPF